MRNGKRILVFMIVCILLFAAVHPASASTAQGVELSKSCELNIRYFYTGVPLTGAQFYVYRIGDITADGKCSLTGGFAGYPVDTSHLTSGVLSDSAELLYSYALLEQLAPDAVLTVQSDGTADGQLPVGLYLIAGQKYIDAYGRYTTGPMIVSLPHRFSETEAWHYDITLEPKCNYLPKGRMEKLNRSVMKIWQDNDSPSRPQEIRVSLLRDRTVADTVTLNAANRWTHKWTSLSEEYEWRVVEEPVDGYTVDVDLVFGIFLVTNTKNREPAPTPTPTAPPTSSPTPTPSATPGASATPTPSATPGASATPTPSATPGASATPAPSAAPENSPTPTPELSVTPVPSEPTKPTATPAPTEEDEPKLPQTGLLWWPVPVLVLVGLFLICAGWLIRKGDHHE
ncbi:MAG: Cna B-type domain-containing protein [Clostridia bacterium]|nr:Cna B-type domain-containing protein [Clostridia bacterium]